LKVFKISDLNKAISGKLIQGSSDMSVHSISIDSRTLKPGDLFFALSGPNFDGHHFAMDVFDKDGCGIVIDRKIDMLDQIKEIHFNKVIIEVEDTLKALQDWAKFLKKKFKTYNICITGSTGKTTTKELTSSILSLKYRLLKTAGNYNNEIGIPLTLLKLKEYHEILIIEMGMRGLGEIRDLTDIVKPDLAVITNIGVSHIGLLGSKRSIFSAKSEILTALSEDGIAVLNRDDNYYHKLRELVQNKKIFTFGIKNASDIMASNIQFNNEKGMKFHFKIGKKQINEFCLPLLGIHNIYNALAATAIAFALGVDDNLIIKGLTSIEPIKMHMQPINFYDGIKILNDSYNASPASVRSALITFQEIAQEHRKIVILGDMLELGKMTNFYHERVGREIAHLNIDYLITLGKGGKTIARSALDNGMPNDCVFSFSKDNKEKLSKKLLSLLKPLDYILIKASRGMEMEKIQKYLHEKYKNKMEWIKDND